jgi:hypothetical protein
VLAQLGGRGAYRRFIADGLGEGRRLDLCGQGPRAVAEDDDGVWLDGLVLGSGRFARQISEAAGQHATEPRARPDTLQGLAEAAARRHGIGVAVLRGPGRAAAVSAARRDLVRAAVLEHHIRPVEVSRFLGISTASIAAHLRAIEREHS